MNTFFINPDENHKDFLAALKRRNIAYYVRETPNHVYVVVKDNEAFKVFYKIIG